jgi:uncharacterized protein (DUF779 family)
VLNIKSHHTNLAVFHQSVSGTEAAKRLEMLKVKYQPALIRGWSGCGKVSSQQCPPAQQML